MFSNPNPEIKGLSHGISSYFGHIQNYLILNGRKPENKSLIRGRNSKEIMINHKGTRMEKINMDYKRQI